MNINKLLIEEKLHLLELRMSKNGQATIQNCFSGQQNTVLLNVKQVKIIKRKQSNNINLDVYGVNINELQCIKMEKFEGENNNIFDEGKNSACNQKSVSIGQVMHKQENPSNKPEHLRIDENNRFCKNISNINELRITLDYKNEQNLWNKDQNSYFGESSNDLLAPQEKFSIISLVEDQLELSNKHKQKQNCVLQQDIHINQCVDGSNSQIEVENIQNKINNNIKQIQYEKNQKSTAKKRKSTQQTLVLSKLKKQDNNVPSFTVLVQNQNQLINHQRLSTESSSSNDLLQLHASPGGNSKITQFFNKKNISSNRQFSSNFSQDDIESNQQYISNYADNDHKNQKENIVQLLTPTKGKKVSILSPQIQKSNYQFNSSKKSILGNQKQIDGTKLMGQNIANSQIYLSPIKLQQTANSGNIFTQQQQYSVQQRSNMKMNNPSSISKGQVLNQMQSAQPKLELKYNNLQEDLKRKDLELSEKNNIIKYLEQDKKEIENLLQNLDQNFQAYKQKVQKVVQQQLIENEKLKREELRQIIQNENQRLGEFVQTRDCTKFEQVWQDGVEFKKIRDRLHSKQNIYLKQQVIQTEKEDLEKKKKNIKGSRKSSYDPESSQDYDQSDIKQRINLQVQFLQKEENDLAEQYRVLEHEKFLYLQKVKRFQDQQNSKYGKSWICLGERYQLLSLLGRGGFSEVYKAYDLQEFRDVACKIHSLNTNWSESSKANYIKHAVRESKIHSKLKHPNIVQLFDIVEIDNNSFSTILEYCEGPDLHFYLKKNKILSEKEAKLLIKQILCALKYMNSQQTRIIHYDLKPQNIIFHKGELKISDFGLSKIFEDGQTRMELTSQGVGTYWYLPPETFEFDNNPQISPKVDVWSVGVIFFEMVFGQRPFGNNKSQEQILKENIILKSTQVNFPSKPNVSNECKDFIRNCLTYDQNRRWDIQKAWDSNYMSNKTR